LRIFYARPCFLKKCSSNEPTHTRHSNAAKIQQYLAVL
jgi:hypothetical protein